jgi:sulfur-oxidizing protein SoxZ
MAPTRIALPETVKRGATIEVRTLIQHVMETGHRRDAVGAAIPRNIVNRFTARFNDVDVFSADLFPGTAANPYLAFPMIAETSGEFVFTWVDDQGVTTIERRRLTVT